MYFDYNKYINNLFEFYESKNMNEPAVFNRKKSHTNKNEDIYATTSILNNVVDPIHRQGSLDDPNVVIENECNLFE